MKPSAWAMHDALPGCGGRFGTGVTVLRARHAFDALLAHGKA
ncbi:MAG: hypothetical protein OXD42_08215 [Rhodospirillaceae bacterium]|nr:hypothetical protein [Rhodospirillaceae bacterium]